MDLTPMVALLALAIASRLLIALLDQPPLGEERHELHTR